ncbi:MAG: putative nucleic-acid-binding protein contains domain [Microvirga sp.]|jgi:predicted nucleic acid-binding protein|nr:putative nucleic-acid-binding protein contains domain [Microvirga sp.]
MSAERYSIDTNILVYSVDRREGEKHLRALDVMERSVDLDCVLTAQALAEFVVAATRRRMLSKPHAIAQARDWRLLFPVVTASALALDAALAAFEAGRFGLWDALLLATAREAGCTTLLSEDMRDGAALDGITVRNPLRGGELPDDLRSLLGMP